MFSARLNSKGVLTPGKSFSSLSLVPDKNTIFILWCGAVPFHIAIFATKN